MKPWYTHSNWTGRTPRTMQEAFGCTYHSFYEKAPSMGKLKHFLWYIACVGIALFLLSLSSGVIKL